jgi:hypothetical protein
MPITLFMYPRTARVVAGMRPHRAVA